MNTATSAPAASRSSAKALEPSHPYSFETLHLSSKYDDKKVASDIGPLWHEHVMDSIRHWDHRPEAYTHWVAIELQDDEARKELERLISQPDSMLCPYFTLGNMTIVPRELYTQLVYATGVRYTNGLYGCRIINVRYGRHLTKHLKDALGKPGKKPGLGWLRAKTKSNHPEQIFSKDFVPEENIAKALYRIRNGMK